MKEFLKSISKTSVMVIGDVILDRYLFGNIKRKSAEAPIDIVDIDYKKEQLGGAANVALSFKNLKVEVLLFGFIGNDAAGEKIISIMKKNKMKTSGLLKQNLTILKTRIITSKKKHHSRFDFEKIDYTESKQRERLLKMIISNIPKIDFLVLQDYNKGALNKHMITTIIAEAKNNQKPVMVDPKEKNFTTYKGVKLIKPNLNEASKLLNRKITITNKILKKAIVNIQEKTKSDWVILTLGSRGLCILHKGEFYRESGIPKKNPDVTGAGDNVICISSLAIFHDFSIKKTAELSNFSGGLCCNTIGTNPINYDELITKLKQNN